MGTEGRTITESSIEIDKYIYTMSMWKDQIAEIRADPRAVEGINRVTDSGMQVFWGDIRNPSAYSVIMETGFFWQAAHIDTCGLYQRSSLCTPQANRAIGDYEAPVSAETILRELGESSKYHQGEDKDAPDNIEWKGVVLASQNPTDRSIKSVGSTQDYYDFFENACEYYGQNLFVKLHPWNSGEIGERLRKIAVKYGVTATKINHRVIRNCDFVLVYNSTFSVDCMMRDVPVAQYAPGYFYQNPAVQFTNYSFPTNVKTDLEFGHKTCDFLMWRYCFDHSMPGKEWLDMFKSIKMNKQIFPLPKEYSYAFRKYTN